MRQNENEKIVRICRKPEVLGRVGVSDVTLWRMEKNWLFPKRRTIGTGIAGWLSTEVDDWFDKLEEKSKWRSFSDFANGGSKGENRKIETEQL